MSAEKRVAEARRWLSQARAELAAAAVIETAGTLLNADPRAHG